MIRKHINFSQAQISFLQKLNKIPFAEHIRRAVDMYIDNFNVSSESPSKKGEYGKSRSQSTS